VVDELDPTARGDLVDGELAGVVETLGLALLGVGERAAARRSEPGPAARPDRVRSTNSSLSAAAAPKMVNTSRAAGVRVSTPRLGIRCPTLWSVEVVGQLAQIACVPSERDPAQRRACRGAEVAEAGRLPLAPVGAALPGGALRDDALAAGGAELVGLPVDGHRGGRLAAPAARPRCPADSVPWLPHSLLGACSDE
jgi:hypothetical protein